VQLDRTELVIRQRSALELFDLSLLVLKRHIGRIALTSALLGIPLLLLDMLAVHWMLSEDALLVAEHLESPLTAVRWRHSLHVILLYVLQFPLISLPTTVFLGNQIFYEDVRLSKLVRRLLPVAGRCLLVLGLFRWGILGLLWETVVDRSVAFDFGVELWLLFGATCIVLLVRAAWPFAPEILALELCPLRVGKTGGAISYKQRSRGLHSLLMTDHMARFLLAGFFGTCLFLMLIGVQMFVVGAISGIWQWSAWFDYVALPLTLWTLGLFLAVFRFLSYLDVRIRLEGWEVELRIKAEAERLLQPIRIKSGSSEVEAEQLA
jgi:hypothetical protein